MGRIRFIPASALALALSIAGPAAAERWVKVEGSLQVEADGLRTDSEGYSLFVTREIDAAGKVRYQHKEALHCGNARHYFRGMYDASAKLDNRSTADIGFADWKTNPREVYNIDRLYALKTTVCGLRPK